jgi:hypothetical protein
MQTFVYKSRKFQFLCWVLLSIGATGEVPPIYWRCEHSRHSNCSSHSIRWSFRSCSIISAFRSFLSFQVNSISLCSNLQHVAYSLLCCLTRTDLPNSHFYFPPALFPTFKCIQHLSGKCRSFSFSLKGAQATSGFLHKSDLYG